MKNGLSEEFFSAAFPGAGPQVRHGRFDANDLNPVLSEFLAELFPNCLCAFLFGSVQRGDCKEWSDVDLLIILPLIAAPLKRRTVYKGYLVEYYLYDLPSLTSLLNHQFDALGALLAAGICSGGLLVDRNGASDAAMLLAMNALRSEALPPDSIALRNARATATSMMIELASNRCAEECVFYGIRLYDLLTNLLVRQQAGCYYNLKFRWRKLVAFEPQLAQEFAGCLKELIATGQAENFLRVCESALDRIGGPLWMDYVRTLPKRRSADRHA